MKKSAAGSLKKLFCGLFALCLALSLVACSGGGNESEESGGGSSIEEEVFVEDNVMPISIADEWGAEKVKGEGFVLSDSPVEKKDDFEMPALLSDNLLLQANVTARVWGKVKAEGVKQIAVRVVRSEEETHTYYGNVESDGNFLVYLGAEDYISSCQLQIVADNGSCYTLKDVAFGELFIGAGQSNMGWSVNQCYEKTTAKLKYQAEINSAANDDIRIFGVGNPKAAEPQENAQGAWNKATPNTVRSASAAAYFFARELNAQYDVPVGILVACMGGTGIVTWTPAEYLDEYEGREKNHADAAKWYNGRIHPIRNIVPRGVLWYQGEGEDENYAHNYLLMMRAWREVFGKENIFFSTVQLPRYRDFNGYFTRRELQKQASEEDKYATYSVNIDLGLYPERVAVGDDLNGGAEGQTPDGIHPYDKKPLGERLAHATMEALYGAKGTWRGPVLKSVEIEGDEAVLTFSNVGKGLILYGDFGFELGNDKKAFVSALPSLRGKNQIVLKAEGVTQPTKVRYGYLNGDTSRMQSCAESVCLWNTKTDNDQAYPAEQFIWRKGR